MRLYIYFEVDVIVCIILGRFDLQGSKVTCTNWFFERNLDSQEYINSGFWPGDIYRCSYLFAEEILQMWYHVQHKNHSASENMFLSSLEEISNECGRVNFFLLFVFWYIISGNAMSATINCPLFACAAQEWEFCRY